MTKGSHSSLLKAVLLWPEDVSFGVADIDHPHIDDVPHSHEEFLGFAGGQAPPNLRSLRKKSRSAFGSSFEQVAIKFMPKAETPEEQSIACDNDMAVCNRKCEEVYGDRTTEMEEPCKLAVAYEFGGGSGGLGHMCFPAQALVEEERRGIIPISEVKVGDVLMGQAGSSSRVIAMLHEDRTEVALYLRVRHSEGALEASPDHLIRALRRRSPLGQGRYLHVDDEWSWVPMQDLRPGDLLENVAGTPIEVLEVSRKCLLGAFAPLTMSGSLIVDGVVCSCYAPPSALNLSHSTCHSAMAPLRLLEAASNWVEETSKTEESQPPNLSLEVKWLSLPYSDRKIHPYAEGLLRLASLAHGAASRAALPRPVRAQLEKSFIALPDLRSCGPPEGIDNVLQWRLASCA
mmetsp:Transcript_42542/g.91830  ORF Transcript_42542/g.91830 Transcript_42542/m.91830 type:complete len:402 (+) Transcript_42542:101-1306(+)